MEKRDAVFFYYGGKMGKWSRKSLIQNFENSVPMIRKMYQIQTNIIIFRKSAIGIIEDWLDNMLNHPEYVIDSDSKDKQYELPEFIESRHDQSVLSAVVYKHQFDRKLLITRQRSERFSRKGQAVFNARISDSMERNPMIYEPLYSYIARNLIIVPYRKLTMLYHTMTNKRHLKKT